MNTFRKKKISDFNVNLLETDSWNGALSNDVETDGVLSWLKDILPTLSEGRGQRNRFADSPTGERWFIKQYHHGGALAGEGDVYYQSPDRFFDEFCASLKAGKAGINVPEPIGVFSRNSGRGYEGFYVSKAVEGTLLSRVLRLEKRWELLDEAGRLLAKCHDAGIDHLDFHVKNCLVSEDDNVVVTDFDPVTFQVPGQWKRSLRVKRFNRSLDKYGFKSEDGDRFLSGYNNEHPLNTAYPVIQQPVLSLKNRLSDARYAFMDDRRWEDINQEKILVRAPNWLGDAVMSLPCLQLLENDPATGRVDVVARPAVSTLFERSPAVESVWQIGNGKSYTLPESIFDERYSLAITIPKSFRTGLQLLRSDIPRRVGFNTQGRGWCLTDRVPLNGEDRKRHHAKLYTTLIGKFVDIENADFPGPILNISGEVCEKTLEKFSLPEQYLTIHPGSAYGPAKRWPPEKFNNLLSDITKKEYNVVAVGVESERSIADDVLKDLAPDRVVNLVGETTLLECMAVLKSSMATVANDSGIMHLSGALETPTVGIFGSSSPELTSPLGPETTVLYENVDCSPCFQRECPLPDDRYKCLTGISVPDVLEVLRNDLNEQLLA